MLPMALSRENSILRISAARRNAAWAVRRAACLALALFAFCVSARAETGETVVCRQPFSRLGTARTPSVSVLGLPKTFVPDSVGRTRSVGLIPADRNRMWRALGTTLPLMAAGVALGYCDNEYNGMCRSWAPDYDCEVDDYLQYAPAAVMVGLKACGYKSRSSWGRMLVSDAFSVAIMAAAVNSCKYSVRAMRPDGSTRNSFPSGHTATAFMTATMLRREYGCRSPWFGVGGYAAATTVAVMRQLNNRHWMSDVMVGAGIGILATELGYFFADMIFRDRGLSYRGGTDFMPERFGKPSFCGIELGCTTVAGSYAMPSGRRLEFSAGTSAAVQGAWFFTPHVGLGGRFSVSRVGMRIEGSDAAERLDLASIDGGLYLSYPFSARWLAGARLSAGWGRSLACRTAFGSVGGDDGVQLGAGVAVTCRAVDNLGLRLTVDYSAAPALVPLGGRLHCLTFGLGAAAMF